LEFGLLYHAALEHYDHCRSNGEDYETSLHSTVRYVLKHTWDFEINKPKLVEHDYKNRSNLLRTVVWYLEQFHDEELKTLILANGKPAVELSFKVELDIVSKTTGENFILCGHFDRMVEYYNSHFYILDRKTTKSTLNEDYFNKFKPDNQFTLYAFAGKIVYKTPIKGVICDAAQVGKTFSRFERKEINMPDSFLLEFYEDLKYWLHLLEYYAVNNYWPKNEKSCGGYFGCPYRGICSMAPSDREPFLVGTFKTREWNPLQARGDV